jgi:branched-chain amino acid transport system substrate-binding protein
MRIRNGMCVVSAGLVLLVGTVGCSSSSKPAASSSTAPGQSPTTASSSSGGGSSGLPSGTTVTIGIDQPISGAIAAYGGAEANGAKYAATVVNSQHLLGPGVTLKLDIKDDGDSEGQAVVNANSILASDDVAMFGPILTASANATTALTGSKMLTVLTQADAVKLDSSDPDVYNMTPTGVSTFNGLGAYLKSKGVKTLAFVYDPNQANQPPLMAAAKPVLSADGIQVVKELSVDSKQTQFTPSMNQLANEKPDAVDILVTSVTAVMLRELQADGYKGVLATYSGPASLFAPAGSAANGLVQPVFFTTLKPINSQADAFLSGYKSAYGQAPSSYNSESYDAIMFIVQAIKMAGSTSRSAVATAAMQLSQQGFTGVDGDYTFNSPDYANRRANLSSQLLLYGANGQPASVTTEG